MSDVRKIIDLDRLSRFKDNMDQEIAGQTPAISGNKLTIGSSATPIAQDIVNVNDINGVPTTAYGSAAAARAAVDASSGLRIQGQIITYLLADGWYTDQYIGSATDSTSWGTASNWKTLGPVSVSQNTETGKTELLIGGTPALVVDNEPEAENDNLINSKGVAKGFQKGISNINKELYGSLLSAPTYAIGSINDSGQNENSDDSVRSNFISGSKGLHIIAPLGYAVKKVVAYLSESLSTFYAVAFSGNAQEISIPEYKGYYLRVVLATNDGSDATTDIRTDILLYTQYDSNLTHVIGEESKLEKIEEFATDVVFGNKTTTWRQGDINTSTGANESDVKTMRCGFISNAKGLNIVVNSLYYIKSILAYNSESLSNYDAAVYQDDGSHQSFYTTTKSTKYLRIVIARKDDSILTDDDIIAGVATITSAISDIPTTAEKSNTTETALKVRLEDNPTSFRVGSINPSTGENVTSDTSIRTGMIDIHKGISIIVPEPYYVKSALLYGSTTIGSFIRTLWTDGTTNKATLVPQDGYIRFVCKKVGDGTIASSVEDELEAKAFVLPYTPNPLYNKTIYFLGDSIPAGSVINGTAPTKPYPKIIAEHFGMQMVNYSIGGSTIASPANIGGVFDSMDAFNAAEKDTGKYYCVTSLEDMSYKTFEYSGGAWVESSVSMRCPASLRYANMSNDADIVVVCAGSNDFQYNWTEIGTMSDRTVNTFYGAIHVLCLGLLEKYFKKEIIFITPIKRCQYDIIPATSADTEQHRGGHYSSVDSENYYNKTLKEYGEIIKEVCSYYSIPVIDAYSESQLNPHVASQLSLFDDWKTHPYQDGHNMMARYLCGKLKSLISYYD